jgi:hypothetical protein
LIRAALGLVLLTGLASAQTFDGSFESGNLGSVTQIGPDAFDLTMRPDTLAANRQWFHFSIADAGGRTLTLSVLDFDISAPWTSGMTPCVSSNPNDENAWARVAPNQVSYSGNDLTFSWTFADDLPVWFAYSFAYDHTRARALIASVETSPFATRRVIGTTLLGRELELLEITEGVATPKPGVWIQARQHPAECGGSWTSEGLLEWLVGPSLEARALRENMLVHVVPMMNPDGVVLGNYRRNSLGLDLNREWDASTPVTSPTVWAALQELAAIEAGSGLAAFIDVHTHSSFLKNWVYGVSGSPALNQKEQGWAQELETLFSDFSFSMSSFTNGATTVAKNSIHSLYPDTISYTHEQTYHTITYGPNAGAPITIARYKAMGVAIGESLVSYLGLCATPAVYGVAKTNSLGLMPALHSNGTPGASANDLRVHVTSAVPGKLGVFYWGVAPKSAPFYGGTMLVAPPRVRFPPVTLGPAGEAEVAVPIDPAMVGTRRYYQFWYRDGAHPGGTGVGISDGLEVLFCP